MNNRNDPAGDDIETDDHDVVTEFENTHPGSGDPGGVDPTPFPFDK